MIHEVSLSHARAIELGGHGATASVTARWLQQLVPAGEGAQTPLLVLKHLTEQPGLFPGVVLWVGACALTALSLYADGLRGEPSICKQARGLSCPGNCAVSLGKEGGKALAHQS